MTFKLPTVLYDFDPYISKETLEYHLGKHHNTYINNLNNLIKSTIYEGKTLENIIKLSYRNNVKVFNNAAQTWNHNFYWNSINKNNDFPSDLLLDKINSSFNSFDEFKNIFKQEAVSLFGSGWVWLVLNGEELKITKTENAKNPLIEENQYPIITCDVWEHAYYLDYKNARNEYVNNFVEHLIDWDFASNNLMNFLKKR